MEARVVEGQRKAAMRLFCREEAGIPDPEQLPIWPEGVDFALVGTVVRELRAADAHELPESLDIDCPTLLLTDEGRPVSPVPGTREWNGTFVHGR